MDGPIRDGWGWGFGWTPDGEAVVPPPSNESLFDRVTQSGPNVGFDDAAAVLGVSVSCSIPGQATGIWFWKCNNDGPQVHPVKMFLDSSQATLGSGVLVSEAAGPVWIYVPFDVPVVMTPATLYVLAVYFNNAAGRYPYNGNFFDSTWNNVSGHLSAPGTDGGSVKNGRYLQPIAGNGFPDKISPGAGNYWVDLEFVPD